MAKQYEVHFIFRVEAENEDDALDEATTTFAIDGPDVVEVEELNG